jgi:hypothetical protein
MPISEAQPDEVGSQLIREEEVPKSHTALSRLTRELSDDDLKSPGVQKLLLELLAEAEKEVAALKSFRANYHEADKRNGVLEEKLKKHTALEIASIAMLAVGGGIMGLAPKMWSQQPAGWVLLITGAVLVIGGIATKAARR